MKILAVSDYESPYLWDHFDNKKFSNIDLILSSGDLKPEYLSFLVTMINAPLFYVPGNHDNKDITSKLDGCTNVDNKIIKYKNIRIIGLGGCHKYNHKYFQYTQQQMQFRYYKMIPKIILSNGLDILLTHAPAFGIGDGKDLCHQGFTIFKTLLNKYKPKYFIHGHMHLNYNNGKRITMFNETKIINSYNYYVFEY